MDAPSGGASRPGKPTSRTVEVAAIGPRSMFLRIDRLAKPLGLRRDLVLVTALKKILASSDVYVARFPRPTDIRVGLEVPVELAIELETYASARKAPRSMIQRAIPEVALDILANAISI